eukprot:TRINITY_DN11650_c0_g1_i1.p1 TRINITY_DN11650_c0_g1~~TRINITY_DN11650_c0_g1_i1.p1  ORF type:complete len:805 (+),score=224.39 TRINITY_DN11650_c0_g1_i1:59-2473(+)
MLSKRSSKFPLFVIHENDDLAEIVRQLHTLSTPQVLQFTNCLDCMSYLENIPLEDTINGHLVFLFSSLNVNLSIFKFYEDLSKLNSLSSFTMILFDSNNGLVDQKLMCCKSCTSFCELHIEDELNNLIHKLKYASGTTVNSKKLKKTLSTLSTNSLISFNVDMENSSSFVSPVLSANVSQKNIQCENSEPISSLAHSLSLTNIGDITNEPSLIKSIYSQKDNKIDTFHSTNEFNVSPATTTTTQNRSFSPSFSHSQNLVSSSLPIEDELTFSFSPSLSSLHSQSLMKTKYLERRRPSEAAKLLGEGSILSNKTSENNDNLVLHMMGIESRRVERTVEIIINKLKGLGSVVTDIPPYLVKVLKDVEMLVGSLTPLPAYDLDGTNFDTKTTAFLEATFFIDISDQTLDTKKSVTQLNKKEEILQSQDVPNIDIVVNQRGLKRESSSNLSPQAKLDLSALETIVSTGKPPKFQFCEREKKSLEDRNLFLYKKGNYPDITLDFDVYQHENIELIEFIIDVFNYYGFCEIYHFSEDTLKNFLIQIHNSYYENPFHNFKHACDVLFSTFYLLQTSKFDVKARPIEVFSILIAAIGHDLRHLGVSNQFLKRIHHDICLFHNDSSPLESEHCRLLFVLLNKYHEIIDDLTEEEYSSFRTLVISFILGTDMSSHLKFKVGFETLINNEAFKWSNDDDRQLLGIIILKTSDLSNVVKSYDLCCTWANNLTSEFLLQGDAEKSLHLPVTQHCDRGTFTELGLCNMQIAFLQFLEPFFSVVSSFSSEMKYLLIKLKDNKIEWEKKKKRLEFMETLQ